MEVNLLSHEELKYELSIRGLPTTGNFAQKRTSLREALRLEREGHAPMPTTTNFDPVSELCMCRAKLYAIERDIQRFDTVNKDNEYKRLNSQLVHSISRLSRVFPDVEQDCSVKKELLNKAMKLKEDLEVVYNGGISQEGVPSLNENVVTTDLINVDDMITVPLQNCNDTFESLIDMPLADFEQRSRLVPERHDRQPSRPPVSSPNFVPPQQASNITATALQPNFSSVPSTVFRNSHVRFSDPVANSSHVANANTTYRDQTLSHSNPVVNLAERLENFQFSPLRGVSSTISQPIQEYNYRHYDIGRWNLTYDGQSSLNDFLERLEELRRSRGISKDQLLRSAPELLTRDALLWYRTKHFLDWDDLVSQLKDAFMPYDYETGIWDEIRRRTQGSQEKVISFIVALENLFRKLPVLPPESHRLQIMKRNLLPYIQSRLATHEILSIQDLLKFSRSVEETEIRIQRFVPPPTNYRTILEPQLAYRKPNMNISAVEQDIVPVSNYTQCSELLNLSEAPPNLNVINSSQAKCWNCQEHGHIFSQCTKQRRKFCFKCGTDNVTFKTCPKCSKNEPGAR